MASTELDQLTRGRHGDFLASRPRTRRGASTISLGVVAGLLDWAVIQEMLTRPSAR